MLGTALATALALASPVAESPHLWATVNACDTRARPDAMGIRASMPGRGRREVLYMRFRVQFQDPRGGRWRFVERGADSGRRRIGATRVRRLESGWNFRFDPPEGGAFVLRGHVTFEWTRGGRRVDRAVARTEAGHRSSRGADPPGYSAATCRIA